MSITACDSTMKHRLPASWDCHRYGGGDRGGYRVGGCLLGRLGRRVFSWIKVKYGKERLKQSGSIFTRPSKQMGNLESLILKWCRVEEVKKKDRVSACVRRLIPVRWSSGTDVSAKVRYESVMNDDRVETNPWTMFGWISFSGSL